MISYRVIQDKIVTDLYNQKKTSKGNEIPFLLNKNLSNIAI